MKREQVELVKASWKIFQSINPVLIGDVFYSKLFIDSPRLKSLFHIAKDTQSLKLIEMLNVLVGRLDRLDELTEDISRLALRHVVYGVKAEHYKAVGAALLWMLQQGLGKDWNKDVADAWTACYDLLSKKMIEAAAYPEARAFRA